MPSHWEALKLKYIARVNFSNVDKHTKEEEASVRLCNYVDAYYNDYINEELDLMKATATSAEMAKFTLRSGDVIITKDSGTRDNIAVPAYVPDDMPNVLCGYNLAQIRPDSKRANGEYLFRAFCCSGINDQFRISATGVIYYHLGNYDLDNGLFVVPPKDEQRSIVTFLNRRTACINVLIEKKKKQIELLREKRVALISHAVTKGLDPNAKMKDSGIEWLGEIPKHWQVCRAKVLFQQIDERSMIGEEELLTVSHITGVTRRSEKNVNMFMAESLEGYKKCESGDLVINTMWAWMGAIGNTPEAGIVSPDYNVYRLRDNKCEAWFYDYLFRTGRFLAEVICHSKGVWSSRFRLYPEDFFEIRLPCPPIEEQRHIITSISKETGHYDVLQKKIEDSIEALHEYRASIISAAVTGKIDVREKVS